MFKEHYRKDNIFVSSLSKISKTEIFFSNLLLKIGGRKNEKSGEEKFSVLATAERSGGVGATRVTTDSGRSLFVGDTTRVARGLIIEILRILFVKSSDFFQ